MKKALLLLAIAVTLMCVVGCAKEQTSLEAFQEYIDREPVQAFIYETPAFLEEMNEAIGNADAILSTEAKVEIDMICEDIIGMENVPEKCRTLHAYYVESAEATMEAVEWYDEAVFQMSYGHENAAARYLGYGTEALQDATEAVGMARAEMDRLLLEVEE